MIKNTTRKKKTAENKNGGAIQRDILDNEKKSKYIEEGNKLMSRWHYPSWYRGMCKWWILWRERKTTATKYEGAIKRDIIDNKRETNQGILEKVIEECPDLTSPVEIEECINGWSWLWEKT